MFHFIKFKSKKLNTSKYVMDVANRLSAEKPYKEQ